MPPGRVTPAVRTNHDQIMTARQGPERLHQPGQVLARLQRADEQEVGPGQAQASPRRGHVVGSGALDRSHPERHPPQAVGADAGLGTVVQRRLRRAEHKVGMVADAIQTGAQGPDPVGAELARIVEEGQVVHGDHEWPAPGRDDDRGGVDEVDVLGHQLDRRPAQPPPGLVQRQTGQGEPADRHRRREGGVRRRPVMSRHADELHVRSRRQLSGQAERGHGRAPGHGVPALLEGVGHTHGHQCHRWRWLGGRRVRPEPSRAARSPSWGTP